MSCLVVPQEHGWICFFPNVVVDNVQKTQKRMMSSRSSNHVRSFVPEDLEYCRDFSSGKPKWIAATVVSKTKPLSYAISLSDGRSRKRHIDHLIPRGIDSPSNGQVDKDDDLIILPPLADTEIRLDDSSNSSNQQESVLRRSTRTRSHPDRYEPRW